MIIERYNGTVSQGTITASSTNLSMNDHENIGFSARVLDIKFERQMRLPDRYNIGFTVVTNRTDVTLIKMCAKYYVAEIISNTYKFIKSVLACSCNLRYSKYICWS